MSNFVPAVRFKQNPIITEQLGGKIGSNINGPSLIKVPSWLPDPLGRYYLYFAHHHGEYIRLAYAQELAGPWTIYEPGTLKLSQTICQNHIASPDVHVDNEKQQIRMYFHGPVGQGRGQVSLVATSANGINFTASAEILGESYFRAFQWGGYHYAMASSGILYRSMDGLKDFEAGPNPFGLNPVKCKVRHVALKLDANTLSVFYSMVGDRPEKILLSKIELTPDWKSWKASLAVKVLTPETDYEGVDHPLMISRSGAAPGKMRELRDPAIYREDDKDYLLYSVAGESGIALAELSRPKLSIITTCKGRLEHLKQTLPSMVAQGADAEVIVVDYDCPDGTASWVEENHPQVRVVKVSDGPVFNISRARNLGASVASSDWLLFIDADTLIPAEFMSMIYPTLKAGNYYHPHHRHPNAYGTFFCTRADFLELEGYDEVLRPWGGEDRDIYYRLQHFLNRTNPGFPGEWLVPILHSDSDRLRFSDVTDKFVTQRANAFYLMVKYDLCRLADKHQLPMELRQHLYETIRKLVLENAANGSALTKIEVDASGLPSAGISRGWLASRKLVYELFPEANAQNPIDGTSEKKSGQRIANRDVTAYEGESNFRDALPAGHIVMFHLGRCGSSVLGNMLDQHPLIEWEGELYQPKGTFYHKHGFNGDAVDPLGFLNKRISGATKPKYGFEIKPYQSRIIKLPVEKLITSLDDLGFTKFILLQRKNMLRIVVSSLVAGSTKRWHVPVGVDVLLTKTHLNVNMVSIGFSQKSLLELLREYEADMLAIERLLGSRSVIKLSYEDDLEEDPQVGYRMTCDFLGVVPAPVVTRLGRTTPFPLSEVLENFDEVAATLCGTEFEWMLWN